MCSKSWKLFLAGLAVVAMAGVAQASPGYGGGGCPGCHGTPGQGDMAAVPDPIDIALGGSADITFDILAMPSSASRVNIQGLDAGLGAGNYTVGGNFALTSGSSPPSFSSAQANSPANDMVLTLGIDAAATPGLHVFDAYLVNGATAGSHMQTTFAVNVIPEPGTVVMFLTGLAAVGMMLIRRRRKA